MFSLTIKQFFTTKLLEWNLHNNNRKMPWKGIKDPYKIWLSEIMLQQTRVSQGLAYYEKFIEQYPTINDLANAKDKEVFKLWEGLGYYSRCKNLLFTARYISFNLKGIFPHTYNEIISLKGVGAYTAAAIASFAFNQPYAVVDGNVLRVLARYFNIDKPIDVTANKKYFAQLAQELLPHSQPAHYNQAIMDFGAIICKPKQPLCYLCVLQKKCISLKKNVVEILPVKQHKIIKKHRYLYYIIATYKTKMYIKKRTAKDIWQNLWEFILVEMPRQTNISEVLNNPDLVNIVGSNFETTIISKLYKQQITHQTIHAIFIHVTLKKTINNNSYLLAKSSDLGEYGFAKITINYFEDWLNNK